jgi:hypothetical protein
MGAMQKLNVGCIRTNLTHQPLELKKENFMPDRISIVIEKIGQGYAAYSPEIANSQVQGSSFEDVTAQIQVRAKDDLEPLPAAEPSELENTTGQSLLALFDSITADMTPDEIAKLPADGAEQHDHYIYGLPKRRQ